VDGHAPRVAVVDDRRSVHRVVHRRGLAELLCELRVATELVDCGGAHHIAPFQRLLELCAGEWARPAGLANLHPRSRPDAARGAYLIRVEASSGAHATGAAATVSQMNRDAVVGLTGLNPHRRLDATAAERQHDRRF